MTHPDIVRMERHGCLRPKEEPEPIGVCRYCGTELFRDGAPLVESPEGRFCDMECCCAYYGIEQY